MIRVEQIRLLETKVQKAVSLLSSLQEENTLLKTRLGEYEKRVDDLEYLLEEFKEEQQEIEQGIISALNKLETLEVAAKQPQEPLGSNATQEEKNSEMVQETTTEPAQESAITNHEDVDTSTETSNSSSTISESRDHLDTQIDEDHSESDVYETATEPISEITEEEQLDQLDNDYDTRKPPELDIF